MTTEWFRNTTWNDVLEQSFNERLRRSKNKSQYLRIQACTLARSDPATALKLLARYFELDDDLFHAQAYVDQATALIALGRIDDAIRSFERALAREKEFPNVLSSAYLSLPFLIAKNELESKFERAIELLEVHQSRLTFPYERFQWYASQAMIAASMGNMLSAKEYAEQALGAARETYSGFQNEPSVGIVGTAHGDIINRLQHYAG